MNNKLCFVVVENTFYDAAVLNDKMSFKRCIAQ